MSKATKVRLIITAICVGLILILLLAGFLYLRIWHNYVPVSLADLVLHCSLTAADFDRYDYLDQNTVAVDIGHGLTIRTALCKDLLNRGEKCHVDFLGRTSALGRYYHLPRTRANGGQSFYRMNIDNGKTDYTDIFLLNLKGESMLIQVVSSETFYDNQNTLVYEHEQDGLHYQYFYLDKLRPDYELSSKEMTITVKMIHEWLERTKQANAARWG